MIFNLHIKYTESRLKLSSIFRMEIGGNLCNLTFNIYSLYPMTLRFICRKHIPMFSIYRVIFGNVTNKSEEKKKWKNGQNVTERLTIAEMLCHKGGKLKEKRRGKWGKWSLAFSNQSFRPCSMAGFQYNLALYFWLDLYKRANWEFTDTMVPRLVYFPSRIGSIMLLWKQ